MLKLSRFFLGLFSFVILVTTFFLLNSNVHASSNIDPLNSGNQYAELDVDGSQINFDCDSCNVEVGDNSVDGLLWGSTTGFINMQPDSGGVVNDGTGVLSGNAFGDTTSWINFSPSGGGVTIDGSTGMFNGYAWSQSFGWINFSCPGASCVETSWRPELEAKTNSESNVGETSAKLNGEASVLNGLTINRFFEWGTSDSSLSNIENLSGTETDSGSLFSFTVSGLSDNTVYYFRACIEDTNNTSNFDCGNTLSFTTDDSDSGPGGSGSVCTDSDANNTGDPLPCTFDDPEIYGCSDPDALNYEIIVTVDDGSCEYEDPVDVDIFGCTDTSAINFQSDANIDDGSCIYSGPGDTNVYGCLDPNALNYDVLVTVDNGSCEYEEDDEEGVCSDPEATNYEPSLTGVVDDSLCEYEDSDKIEGCTDSEAFNYDEEAEVDDGSCEPVIYGCLDNDAFNYDENANTADSDSCLYVVEVEGCMDYKASNFNSSATIDNGSCVYGGGGGNDDPDPDDDPEDDDPVGGDPIDPGTDPDNGPTFELPGGGEIFEVFDGIIGDIRETAQDIFGDAVENVPLALAGAIAILGPLSAAVAQPTTGANVLKLISRWLGSVFTGFAFRKRRKPWGTVYDSETKQPLDPVYVSLKNILGEETQSAITDIDGRYGFLVDPDNYVLSTQKTDYVFPSEKMKGKMTDLIYNNLYFGQEFEVRDQDEILNHDIPMDPINFNWNEFEKKRTGVMKFHSNFYLIYVRVARILFWAGFLFTLVVTPAFPTKMNFIILGLYVVSLVLQLTGKGGFRTKGMVRFAKDKTPLSFGVIRVFSAKLGREVRKTVIGPTGAYFILIPKGEYYFTVEQRLGENKYEEIYRSEPKRVNKGFMNKKLSV